MITTPPSSGIMNYAMQAKSAAPAASQPAPAQGKADEHFSRVSSLQQRLVDNHGYDTKESVKAALTTNTKIINTPAMERGSLLDIRI